ncbi:response regulator transcription factor [Parapedobacter koreensis]|uniref:Regulatory protein, luxR family n=1 Tax=Parapedobacter koreensis TaxID=332977 RepID=A0A1H7NLJ4_9SPHI|nr:response regulator transcription factor [Parapedobacter koreensis]SEL24264.1 regulatory protein, luxR family [Parapedobacter koreensis]
MAKKRKQPTWLEYTGSIGKRNYHLSGDTLAEATRILKPIGAFASHFMPAIYLLDYTTGTYLSVTQNSEVIFGIHPDEFLEGGLACTIPRYRPDHLMLLNEEIFPDRVSFIRNIPPAQHANYIFTYSLQFKTSEGFTPLVQRSCFLQSDENGTPLLSLGMIIRMSGINNDERVVQTVEYVDPSILKAPELISTKNYYTRPLPELFSRREREVLLWMAEGLTSKEIADKLFVSEHTIINHRRHMQEKCNVSNSTALVSFALRKGIIT